MASKIRLITLYDFIYESYNTELKWQCQRFSPNGHQGFFTDEEILTCYLFSIIEEEKFLIKKSYQFIKKYWADWFPNLPSYQAFNARLNRLAPVLQDLVATLSILLMATESTFCYDGLIDSFPIRLSSGKRKGKIAPEYSVKSYCSTKNEYYHGIKCHVMAMSRSGQLPLPIWIKLSPGETHDSTPVKLDAHLFRRQRIFADKAYDFEVLRAFLRPMNCEVITPQKAGTREPKWEQQQNQAYRNILQTAVSAVRQPIESFFNWLNEKTNIQNASKVRSSKGLWVHTFGKIAAALLLMLQF